MLTTRPPGYFCSKFRTNGPAAEKRDLRTYANSEDPDQTAHLDFRCSRRQYKDLVKDTGLIAKILTRRKQVWASAVV